MRIGIGGGLGVPPCGRTVERWGVHGFYQTAAAGRRHFSLTLLREAIPIGRAAARDAFCLLASVLDPATGRHETLSQLDAVSAAALPRVFRAARGSGLNPHVLEALASEMEAFGLPRGHRGEAAPASVTRQPFRATWKDFGLAETRDGFDLSFTEPGEARACRLHLRPERAGRRLPGAHLKGAGPLKEVVWPRLAVAGEVAGEPVRGEAWAEHAPSDVGWLVPRAGEGVFGWDRLAVNLDDGPDLVLARRRDLRNGGIVHTFAVEWADEGEAALSRAASLEPRRRWESPRTGTPYPVAMSASVPEWGLELDFEPLADDQEAPVFGPLRALWHGAGTVRGRLHGRRVEGRAHLALHGYACVLDTQQYLVQWADRLDAHVAAFLPRALDEAGLARYAGPPHWRRNPAAHTAMLAEPLWDLIQRRGKHWRPMFGMLLLEALGTPSKPYEALAAITGELAHTGSLIVDDIQDGSPTRRGAESIHRRYGVDVAISAANTAYFLGFVALRDYPHLTDAQRLALYRIASTQAVRAHLGQGQDIWWSRHLAPEALDRWLADSLAPQILQTYADKTGTATEGMAETACVIAGADAATREACVAFARDFGVAFQIVDDVLDFSDSRLRAGTGGKDIAEGKVTYALFRALGALGVRRRARLRDILCSSELRRSPEGQREAAGLVRRSGALEACRQEARNLMNEGWRRLSAAVPPSEPKTLLRALCLALLSADGGAWAAEAEPRLERPEEKPNRQPRRRS
ncbi:MAG TPA: polyprenyl synthetase family protein [Planctomycetota bacterium]|nr:polyprenyl synthetase family protein [Planctomycetota bacterium]HRR80262.1 polyprenyl synthetase family protein [Planctomycetota bacterium]HRT93370.1 polyprenyl synthetase family protein [Planctomycetota bacterium]